MADELISDSFWTIFNICSNVISGAISIFGITTSVLNIIIFHRQGYSDAANVSLQGLTVSELGGLISLAWLTACVNPLLTNTVSLPYSPGEFQYVTGGYPRTIFSRTTYWITIFITIQRCLCTAFPFQIKSALSPKKTGFILVSIAMVVFMVCVFPNCCTGSLRLDWKSYPMNKTLLGIVRGDNYYELEEINVSINTGIQFISFFTSIIATLFLIFQLKRRSHKLVNIVHKSKSAFKKDVRAVKMTLSLSLILIVCYIPGTICLLLYLFLPGYTDFDENGQQNIIFTITFLIAFELEAANSSLSVFVYYRMSTKYRSLFKEVFRLSPN